MGNHGQPWTTEEDAYILENLEQPAHKLAAVLGRSTATVNVRIQKLRKKAVRKAGQHKGRGKHPWANYKEKY